MSKRIQQAGFSAIESLLVFVILAVVVTAGVFVSRHDQKHSNTSSSHQTSSASTKQSAPTTTNAYAGWTIYTSPIGGLSFEYPPSWLVTADYAGPGPTEYQLFEYGNDVSVKNNFSITIQESTNSSRLTPYGSITNGTTVALSNNLYAWWPKDSSALQTCGQGPCLNLLMLSHNQFYAQLPSGYFVNAIGGFALGQGQATTYTYQEQISSPEWIDAEKIIASMFNEPTDVFTSTDGVFSLKFPKGWMRDGITSPGPCGVIACIGQDMFSPSGTSLPAIYVMEAKSNLTPQEWYPQIEGSILPSDTTNANSVNGYSTFYDETGTAKPTEESYVDDNYVFAHNGYIVDIQMRKIYDNPTAGSYDYSQDVHLYTQMVDSIRFLN